MKITKVFVRFRRLNPRQRQVIIRKISASVALLIAAFLIGFIVSSCSSKAKAADNSQKYFKNITVQSGDTLYSYAEEYIDYHYDSIEDYVSEVAKINHIQPDKLVAGKNIIIPYFSDDLK